MDAFANTSTIMGKKHETINGDHVRASAAAAQSSNDTQSTQRRHAFHHHGLPLLREKRVG
ncbi:hypothetical protein V5799_021712, partial [Amblyomma americanum]